MAAVELANVVVSVAPFDSGKCNMEDKGHSWSEVKSSE